MGGLQETEIEEQHHDVRLHALSFALSDYSFSSSFTSSCAQSSSSRRQPSDTLALQQPAKDNKAKGQANSVISSSDVQKLKSLPRLRTSSTQGGVPPHSNNVIAASMNIELPKDLKPNMSVCSSRGAGSKANRIQTAPTLSFTNLGYPTYDTIHFRDNGIYTSRAQGKPVMQSSPLANFCRSYNRAAASVTSPKSTPDNLLSSCSDSVAAHPAPPQPTFPRSLITSRHTTSSRSSSFHQPQLSSSAASAVSVPSLSHLIRTVATQTNPTSSSTRQDRKNATPKNTLIEPSNVPCSSHQSSLTQRSASRTQRSAVAELDRHTPKHDNKTGAPTARRSQRTPTARSSSQFKHSDPLIIPSANQNSSLLSVDHLSAAFPEFAVRDPHSAARFYGGVQSFHSGSAPQRLLDFAVQYPEVIPAFLAAPPLKCPHIPLSAIPPLKIPSATQPHQQNRSYCYTDRQIPHFPQPPAAQHWPSEAPPRQNWPWLHQAARQPHLPTRSVRPFELLHPPTATSQRTFSRRRTGISVSSPLADTSPLYAQFMGHNGYDGPVGGDTSATSTTATWSERSTKKKVQKELQTSHWWNFEDWECQRQKRMLRKLRGEMLSNRKPLEKRIRKRMKDGAALCCIVDEVIRPA